MRLFQRSITTNFQGPTDSSQREVLPVGISRVQTDGYLGIAYVTQDGETLSMFCLNPGKARHIVHCPKNVMVVVECDATCKWSVKKSNRYEPADPNRVEMAVVRPKSDFEEMQDYLNEAAARALGAENARKLRSGEMEIDTSMDDYSDEHEQDAHVPLSIHQMTLITEQISQDIKKEKKRLASLAPAKPSSSVDKPPPLDLPSKTEGNDKPEGASKES